MEAGGAIGMAEGLQKDLGQWCGDACLHPQLGEPLIGIVLIEQRGLLTGCSLLPKLQLSVLERDG